MSWYRTLIRGENFRMNISGERESMGFYTTRFIEVETPEAVENAAIAVIQSDQKLIASVLNDPSDPPILVVDEIEQVSDRDVPQVVPGFTFFREE